MNEGFDGSVEETKSTYKLSLKQEEQPKTEEKSDESAVEKTVEITEKFSLPESPFLYHQRMLSLFSVKKSRNNFSGLDALFNS